MHNDLPYKRKITSIVLEWLQTRRGRDWLVKTLEYDKAPLHTESNDPLFQILKKDY